MVFQLGDNFETELITFAARTAFAFFNVGPPSRATRKSFDSYFLQDKTGSFENIVPYAWHHLCYSYNVTGYSKMVMVRLSTKESLDKIKAKLTFFLGWRINESTQWIQSFIF